MGKRSDGENKLNHSDRFQGDHGYCYIPYDYMTNPKYCFDAWAIRQIATDNFSRDGWHVTDPINYLDNKTAPYVNPTPYYDQGDIVQDEDDTETDYRQYDYNDGWNDDHGRNDRYDDQRDTDTYDGTLSSTGLVRISSHCLFYL